MSKCRLPRALSKLEIMRRYGELVKVVARSRHRARESSTKSLPDYNTPVDVANIKLTRPRRSVSADDEKAQQRAVKVEAWQAGAKAATEGSLVSDTLAAMEADKEFQLTAKRLRDIGQKRMTLEEKKARRRALSDIGVPPFKDFLHERSLAATRKAAEVLQLNIGLYCNQACNHCHVESSPKRQEMMSAEVAEKAIEILRRSPSVHTLDITGGAPEMNDQFRYLVSAARAMDSERIASGLGPVDIIDRCNLTVLLEPGQEDLPHFLADHRVRVVASLPCYSSKNVNMQRGSKVFERSIQGLQMLNDVGYGVEGSGLYMDLVYNPLGAFLPPPQDALESKYKEELDENFGVEFNSLFTMTNMPIKRFADFLYRRGELSEYMDLLVRNFNEDTVPALMCTNTVSIGWDGKIYDCDFNQQLDTLLTAEGGSKNTNDPAGISDIFSLDSLDQLLKIPINVDSHCYGCTAGMGSS